MRYTTVFTAFFSLLTSVEAKLEVQVVDSAQKPFITPSPVQYSPSRTRRHRRDLFDSIGSDVNQILSDLGSKIPSYVASGVPDFFQGFPTGDSVKSSLGINDAQVSALPTQVLNIDPYANWTSSGWNIRFRGNVYKQPNTSTEDLDKLANKFLIDTDIKSLPNDQQVQARNVTASIFVLQQGNVSVSPVHLESAQGQNAIGQQGAGGSLSGSGGAQDVILPYNTTAEGDFDVFVPIKSDGLIPGNTTQEVQRLNTYIGGASLGNATAYLVPNQGLTIISDIDDILRVTKIYQPKEGLLNSFVRPYTPWQNMPAIYSNWSRNLPNTHFHYLTTLPEQVTRQYMSFIYSTYPAGSFDTRPLNFTNAEETLSVRRYLLDKIFQTFPQRQFILVADTSNSDIMRDYPQMAVDYPGQVKCIFLRNTSATDSGDRFPYDTSGFKNLNQTSYMFFVNADDLTGLDLASGQCYNRSVAQNLTFGYQGLPLSSSATVNGSANHTAGAHSTYLSNGWQLVFTPLLAASLINLFL